jgi:hypothetical protein
MPPTVSRDLERATRRIHGLASERLPAQALVEGGADELRAAVPVDSLLVAATDPDTLLALGAGVVHGMPHTVCSPFWEYEFEVPDFNKFIDVARGPRQVADLHAATGGRNHTRPRSRIRPTPRTLPPRSPTRSAPGCASLPRRPPTTRARSAAWRTRSC